jgi:hypothetical protein
MGKKSKENMKENESYILPSNNEEMRSFISKFKLDMMESIVSSIKFAIENKLNIVEIFQFKNSPFVVTVSEHEFDLNLEHIHKFYVENEIYELCPKVEKLRQLLKNKNEKEKPKTDRNDQSRSQ